MNNSRFSKKIELKKLNEINSRTGSKSSTLFRRIIPYITQIWHRIIYTPFCFRYVILSSYLIGSKKNLPTNGELTIKLIQKKISTSNNIPTHLKTHAGWGFFLQNLDIA